TGGIVAVGYAGQPCDYAALRSIARRHSLAFVADACHALGARDGQRPVGGLADLSTFSLHPVKPITSGEGGMITTDDANLAQRMRQFRNHGFNRDHHRRAELGSWHYEMTELGYNYRLTDFQAALGISQLTRLDGWIARRQEIARQYDRALADVSGVRPLRTRDGVSHGRHLYVVRLDVDRAKAFTALRDAGIGVGVHYVPVHLHPFYRRRFGTATGDCPVAEAAYRQILSLPIFPAMSDADVGRVIEAVCAVCPMKP
ncbi:MAG: DegT/DnrJ/EryC1/StrS family aminotransferase, partial [Candidatus Nealsonbacteria bacterium]|nr:DegT/DnrJ/EryC1/StrS family aminotransferase [Candidatus Nealsonbacteria bacterium]